MDLGATLGNISLLQLAEALSLNAEKVHSVGTPAISATSSDLCLFHYRSAMNWSSLPMVRLVIKHRPLILVASRLAVLAIHVPKLR